MSDFDKLYAGLHKEADNRRFFMERAGDFVVFKKMAAGPQSSESGGTPLEDQPQPHAKTHCPGCANPRSECSCEEQNKEAALSPELQQAHDKEVAALNRKNNPELFKKEAGALSALRSVSKPMLTHGGAGAAIGAAGGAATAAPGESRLRRAALGAGAGAAIGASAGAGRGALKNRAIAAQDAKAVVTPKWDAQNAASIRRGAVARSPASKAYSAAPVSEGASQARRIARSQKVYSPDYLEKIAVLRRLHRSSTTKTADAVLLPAVIGHLSSGNAESRAASPRSGILRGVGGAWGGGALGGALGVGAETLAKGKFKGVAGGLGLLGGALGGAIAGGRSAKATPQELARFQMRNQLIDEAISRRTLAGKEKKAMAYLPANPTSADSSINAQVGELPAVEKTASPSETPGKWKTEGGKYTNLVKAIESEGRRKVSEKTIRDARRWEASGSVGAPPAGLTVEHAARLAHPGPGEVSGVKALNRYWERKKSLGKTAEDGTNNLMSDIKGRAADKYPISEVPSMSDEAMALAEAAKKKVLDAKKARAQLISGTKPRAVTSPIPVPEKYKVAGIGSALKASTVLPQVLRDPKGLPLVGLAALGLGTASYLSSRPQESLGGKSRAEHGLQADVLANAARATDDDGMPTRMRHRMKELQSGLSTDFRKSPAAAAGIGALVGGGIGAKLFKVLGGGR